MAQKNSCVKPYLKWAGGKRQLLPQIKELVPKKYTSYYEPFLGAGAVFFSLQPKKAIINDFNSQLIITYTVIRDHVDELIEWLQIHRQKNCAEYYYKIRGLDRDTEQFKQLTNVQKAARLIYLNKTCFNGLYRVNSQGLFNVPYGRYKNPAIFDESVLRAVSHYLNTSEVIIMNQDFTLAVADADKDSFVYFDPPYHSPNSSNFTGYQAGGFDENEQKRLQQTFIELTERGAKCLLSNSDTPFIRDLYADFDIRIVEATRAINSDSNGRGRVNEVLVKNW